MAYKAIVREINLNKESFIDESEVDPNNNSKSKVKGIHDQVFFNISDDERTLSNLEINTSNPVKLGE